MSQWEEHSFTDGYFSHVVGPSHESYRPIPVMDLPPPQAPFMLWDGVPPHVAQPWTPGISTYDTGMASGDLEAPFGASPGRRGIGQAYGTPEDPNANYEEGTFGSLYLPTPSHMGFAPATYYQMRSSLRARANKYAADTSRVAIPAVFAPVNQSNWYGGLGAS